MNDRRQTSRPKRRQIFWRVFSVVMFVYMCANVSVLEYFGGNLSLGIVSFRQVVELNTRMKESPSATVTETAPDNSQSSDDDIPFDGDDFFCFSSQSLMSAPDLTASLTLIIPPKYTAVFFYRETLSDRHLPPFYRPPRIA